MSQDTVQVISSLAFLVKAFENTDSQNAERYNVLILHHPAYTLYARRKMEL